MNYLIVARITPRNACRELPQQMKDVHIAQASLDNAPHKGEYLGIKGVSANLTLALQAQSLHFKSKDNTFTTTQHVILTLRPHPST